MGKQTMGRQDHLTRKQRLSLIGVSLLALILGLYSLRQPLLSSIGRYPIVADVLDPVDLIVVISGSLPEIHYGIDLYNVGYAPRLLFIGHFPVELAVLSQVPFQVVERPWDEIARHLAISAGVEADDILISNTFTSSTYTRVEALLAVAQQKGALSLIVVSDALHSRRIRYSARQLTQDNGPRIRLAPTPATYYPPAYRYDPDRWWWDEDDLKALVDEYIKLIYYWLRY